MGLSLCRISVIPFSPAYLLFLHAFLVCLSVFSACLLSICPTFSTSLSAFSACLSACLSIYLSLCLSAYLPSMSDCLPTFLSICLTFFLSAYLLIYLSIQQSTGVCCVSGESSTSVSQYQSLNHRIDVPPPSGILFIVFFTPRQC